MIPNFKHAIILIFFLILSTSAFAANQKNMSMYSDGQVFMISDKDWRNVLSLVPLTTWTDLSTGEIHKYPTLAYKDQKKPPALSLKPVETSFESNGKYSLFYPYVGSAFLFDFTIDGYASATAGDYKVVYASDYWSEHCPGDGSTKVLVLDQFFKPELAQPGDSITLHMLIASCDGQKHVLNNFEVFYWPYNDLLTLEFYPQEITVPAGGQQGFIASFKYTDSIKPGFDADSSLHFLKQYKEAKPNIKVTAVLEQPQELLDLVSAEDIPIEKFDAPWKYLSYWSKIDSVFVVDYADYSSGLVASVAASYLNAPLFFVNKDNVDVFKYVVKNRVVLAVGNLDSETKSKLSAAASKYYAIPLIDLQKISAEVSGSDKLLMTNPTDLQDVGIIVEPEKSSGMVSGYTSASLAAPFLAAAKHEVLIPIYSSDYADVDAELDWRINYLGGADKFKYLTIFASPLAITTDAFEPDSTESSMTVDMAMYADVTNNYLPDLATGRIYGITDTDVFSYVALDLYYNALSVSNNALIIHGYDPSLGMKGYAASIGKILDSTGLDVTSVNLDEDEDGDYPYENLPSVSFLKGVSFAGFFDHGYAGGWSGAYQYFDLQEEEIWLKPSIFLSHACSTCAFYSPYLYGTVDNLFCAQVLRRGALAHFGATSNSGAILPTLLVSDIYSGFPLGKAFKNNFENFLGKPSPHAYNVGSISEYILLGDPTIVWSDNLALSPLEKREVTQKILDNGNVELNLHLPSSFFITQSSFNSQSSGSNGLQLYHLYDRKYTYDPPKTPYSSEELGVDRTYTDPEYTNLYQEYVSGLHFCDRLTFSLPQDKKLGAPVLLSIKTGSQNLALGFDPFINPAPPDFWWSLEHPLFACPDPTGKFPECHVYLTESFLIKKPCFKEENGPVKGCVDRERALIGIYPDAMDGEFVVNFCMPSYFFPNPNVNMDDDSFPDYAPARDIIMEIELVDE